MSQHGTSPLPECLSDFARRVLSGYRTKWDSTRRLPGVAHGANDLGMLEVKEAPGPWLLELNTDRCSRLRRHAEGEPIALLRRLEVVAGFASAAPDHYSWFVQPQRCYLDEGGRVLLERVYEVDAGLSRDPRPWLPPDRRLHPFASSLLKVVEKLAFFLDVGEQGHNQMAVRVGVRGGETLAGMLSAVEAPEPSDDVHRFWRGEGLTLHDGELYGRNADECWVWLGAEVKAALPVIVRFAARAGAAVEVAVPSFQRVERREPPEAPLVERVTRTREAVSVSCPYGTEHEAQRGEVLLEETSEGPVVHQIRVDDEQVATWERFGASGAELTDYCLAVDHFRGVVSPRCLEWVKRYNVMHYPWLRANEPELRSALARAGVELTEARLELERMMGGVIIRRSEGPYIHSFGLGLHAERLPKVVLSAQTSFMLDDWLLAGPDGTLTGGDMNEGSCPLARSWRHFLERLAIGYDGARRQDDSLGDLGIGRGRCSVLFTETIGPELARLLEIPESPLLSDDLTFFAEDADSLIWCPFSAAEHDLLLDSYATELVTTNLDRVVDALRVAARCSTTVEFHLDGPADREEEHERPVLPPAELLVGAERFSLSTGRVVRGTAYVVRDRGACRIEVVYDGPTRQEWRTFTPERNTLRWYQHR